MTDSKKTGIAAIAAVLMTVMAALCAGGMFD